MERCYTCVGGHSFKVVGEGTEPLAEDISEVYFSVKCPLCGLPRAALLTYPLNLKSRPREELGKHGRKASESRGVHKDIAERHNDRIEKLSVQIRAAENQNKVKETSADFRRRSRNIAQVRERIGTVSLTQADGQLIGRNSYSSNAAIIFYLEKQ